MKRNSLILIVFLSISTVSISQDFNFTVPGCTPAINVHYSNSNGTGTLRFNWDKNITNVPLSQSHITAIGTSATVSPAIAQSALQSHLGQSIDVSKIKTITPDANPPTRLAIVYEETHIREGITDLNNPILQTSLYTDLTNKTGALTCNQATFFTGLLGQITTLNQARTKPPRFKNPQIVETSHSGLLPVGGKGSKRHSGGTPWYNLDSRNPISFTKFLIRTPRTNGRDIEISPSNYSSYHYVKPGSIINILPIKEVYEHLGVNIKIRAYIKRKNESIVPVTVSGFYDVKLTSNQTEFEKTNPTDATELNYKYDISQTAAGAAQAEINTSSVNPQLEDQLVVTVMNVSDGHLSFTTTFEFEDFGWTHQPIGGFSWVNTVGVGSKNFLPAGTAGYNFYYRSNKGANFWGKVFTPSFGPEMVVLQDAQQNTVIGLGGSISLLLRTVKFGYGWYLNGNNGNGYVSLGINFIEGFQSISSILSRVQTSQTRQ